MQRMLILLLVLLGACTSTETPQSSSASLLTFTELATGDRSRSPAGRGQRHDSEPCRATLNAPGRRVSELL